MRPDTNRATNTRTNTGKRPRKKRQTRAQLKRKIYAALGVIGVIVLIVAILGISSLIKKYTPSKETLDLKEYYSLTEDNQVAIIFNNDTNASKGTQINGENYLDYKFVHDNINSRFYWDENENILLYATSSGLISAEADAKSYTNNKSSVNYKCPVVKATSDSCLIEIDFLRQYSDFIYEYYDEPSRLLIYNKWSEYESASVKKDTKIRQKGGIKSPILTEIEKDSSVKVLSVDENWTEVMSDSGIVGYIQTKLIVNNESKILENPDYVADVFPHIKKDFKINMAWHQVTNQTANEKITNILTDTKGVNVISPTWFVLNDDKGNLKDLANTKYISYCHQQGVEIWPTVNNLDNPDVNTTYILTHTSTRQNLVNQIIAAAIKYELDGINIDFEALSSDVGDGYIQFIRELAIKCSNNGIVLSIDNYVPSPYTEFYNRKEQAFFADYVVIMGYDEHFSGSEPGSVASLNWVSQGVSDTLKSVPADQTILGIPFYCRLWETDVQDGEEETATEEADLASISECSVYSMGNAAKLVANQGVETEWLNDCGQEYATWEADGKIYQIWLENIPSIEEKLKLVTSNNLAGAAFWKLGFEKNEVWDTIIKYVN